MDASDEKKTEVHSFMQVTHKWTQWACLLIQVCHPSKLLFSFLFVANKHKFAVSVFRWQQTNGSWKLPFYRTMCIYVYLYCCSKRKMEAQVIFFNPYVYLMLILETEVCHLSVCWWRKKQKLSVCKWAKQTKRTKRTCPSMPNVP